MSVVSRSGLCRQHPALPWGDLVEEVGQLQGLAGDVAFDELAAEQFLQAETSTRCVACTGFFSGDRSHKDNAGFEYGAVPVGAGSPAKRPVQATSIPR
ncbi:protein of unknown function [Pseudomonas sp. JV551A1]|uniref:Uncharacterized protein n=1 Tax=Pseudomonas inefficax TaxID=2078786 RepID=A0AAQ1PCZ6_9PSED|nr:protein of unknown function [Pseudomonas sp. JV551A1]SPO62885.1 protein of unknown function [Pseudomonas inefficax]